MKDLIFKYDPIQKCFDLDIENVIGDSLESKICMLLFTDAQCENYELPAQEPSKKGFWANPFDKTNMGSKLWLIKRAKKTKNILNDINSYCMQALEPLKQDSIVSNFEINSHFENNSVIVNIDIYTHQGKKEKLFFSFGDDNELQNSNIQRTS